jgi:hypothetical protein
MTTALFHDAPLVCVHCGRVVTELPDPELAEVLAAHVCHWPSTVYLLHFLAPIGNPANRRAMAQHYIGADLNGSRISVQTAGQGAAIVRYVQAQGIGFQVARTWPGGREVERRLKRRKNAPRLCPICRGEQL